MICKNCNTNLHKDQLFCAQCGAQVIIDRITTKKFINEFIERYFSLDNKFLLTFKTLFTKPEDVILGYFNGVRKKYINPFSFLLIAITLYGFQFFLMNKGILKSSSINMLNKEKSPLNSNEYIAFLSDYQSIITILSFPVMALLTKILFNKIKAYNFAEHMVLNIYLFNQITILGSIITIVLGLIGIDVIELSFAMTFIHIGYYMYALKRIYSLSIGKILLKTLLFILLVLSIYIMLIFIVYKILLS